MRCDVRAGRRAEQHYAREPMRVVDGILLLDKPEGMTSNVAMQRVKRLYRAEKAGHAGSLDPIATGLLPICLGKATRIAEYLLDADKCYRGTARFGAKTDTGDREGSVISCSNPEKLDIAALRAVVAGMLGVQYQIPPMYSALKRGGVPLYVLARRGMNVPRSRRMIKIRELRAISYRQDLLEFEVLCSKGTYVRTLVEDWASAVGQCAHLIALRRTAVGLFSERSLVSMYKLEQMGLHEHLDALLLPTSAALGGWRRIVVNEEQRTRMACGQAISLGTEASVGRLAVFDSEGFLLGIAEGDPQGMVRPKRWLASPGASVTARGTCR